MPPQSDGTTQTYSDRNVLCAGSAEFELLRRAFPSPHRPPPNRSAEPLPCQESDRTGAASPSSQIPVEPLRGPAECVHPCLITHESVALLRVKNLREILSLMNQLLAQ